MQSGSLYRSKSHRCTSSGVAVLLDHALWAPVWSSLRALRDHRRIYTRVVSWCIAPRRTRSSVASSMKTDVWFDVQR
jgi:hypothetical protein